MPPRAKRYGWAPSAIREMLRRETYRGFATWNRTQSVQRGGTKTQRRRKESEWLRLEAPELRIINEDLWERVQARLKNASQTYLRTSGGRLLGRPSKRDIGSTYLLSGIAQCAVCGGSISVFNRRRANYERKLYGCVHYHKRGTAICSNGTQVPMDILDSAVLHAIHEILDEKILEGAVQEALEKIRRSHGSFPDKRTAIQREISLIETRLMHLVEIIARGESSETVLLMFN